MKLSKYASGEKELQCPHCMTNVHVYHCAWYALTCPYCKTDVEKPDWIVAAQPALADGSAGTVAKKVNGSKPAAR